MDLRQGCALSNLIRVVTGSRCVCPNSRRRQPHTLIVFPLSVKIKNVHTRHCLTTLSWWHYNYHNLTAVINYESECGMRAVTTRAVNTTTARRGGGIACWACARGAEQKAYEFFFFFSFPEWDQLREAPVPTAIMSYEYKILYRVPHRIMAILNMFYAENSCKISPMSRL